MQRKQKKTVPMSRPFSRAVFEDLKHSGPDIVFRVEPGKSLVRMEGCGPAEASIRLELHAEEWVGETGEVVVVDARVDESSGYANLSRYTLLFPP